VSGAVAAELDALRAAIVARRPDADARIYDGELGAEGVRKLSLKTPAVVFTCTRAVPVSRSKDDFARGGRGPGGTQDGYEWVWEADFVAAVLARHRAAEERHRAAWSLADDLLPVLWDRAALDVRVANGFSQALWDRGHFLLLLSWGRALRAGAAAGARFEPASVSVDDGESAREEYPA